MVTLSVTRSRIATVLAKSADLLEAEGWDPERNTIMHAIDRAADYQPGTGTPDAEAASLAAWDALCVQLGNVWPLAWESGRTQAEVLTALRGAAQAVAS